MHRTLPLVVIMWAAVAGLPLAQNPASDTPVPAARAQLARRTLSRWLAPHQIAVRPTFDVNGSEPAHELAVVWQESAAVAQGEARAPGDQATAGARPVELRIARRVDSGSRMPRIRSMHIAEGQLLAAAVDAGGILRGVAVIADPRVVRAEWPGPDGVLAGRTLRLSRAEFLLPVPDDPRVVAVHLFEPRWNGEAFVLQPIAFVQVSGGADR